MTVRLHGSAPQDAWHQPPLRSGGKLPRSEWSWGTLGTSGRTTLRTFTRYLLLEVPGWVLAALVAVVLHRWVGLSAEAGALLVAVWVVKDLVLYPWLRDAYAGEGRSPKDRLLEETGVVVQPLRPVGIVRLGAELWRAEAATDGALIPRGRRVRVREVRGLKLMVTETEEPTRPEGGPPAERKPLSDG